MPTRSREAERYQRAAKESLKLLDWCIWYFRRENHGQIATRLEQNRAYIRKRLTGEPEEVLAVKSRARAQAEVPIVKPLQKVLETIGLKSKPRKKRAS